MFNVKHKIKLYPKEKKIRSFHNVSAKKINVSHHVIKRFTDLYL